MACLQPMWRIGENGDDERDCYLGSFGVELVYGDPGKKDRAMVGCGVGEVRS